MKGKMVFISEENLELLQKILIEDIEKSDQDFRLRERKEAALLAVLTKKPD